MRRNEKQKGSALVYILIAIALLAALTATFMDSSSQQTSSQNSFNTVAELKSQINMIRSAIDECVLTYPGGDSTMPANPVGGENPIRPYPLNAYNTYMTSPSSSTSYVSDIRCPGNPGNSNNHAKIFGGTSGKFLPQPPKLFTGWFYYNNIDGVFILNATDKSDAFLTEAMKKIDSEFSKCEVQYIDASAGLVHTTSNNNTGYACGAGWKCLRIWIKPTASAIYPGETGCP